MFDSKIDPRDLDLHVRRRLADSLDHVFDRTASQLDLETARVGPALACIRESRIDPGVFARYFDLVFSIDAQDWEKARTLASEILSLARQPAAFKVVPYTQDALGDDFERFPKLVFATFTDSNPMAAPSEDLFASCCEKITEAREIVREVDPGIDREIESLLTRIVVAARNPLNPDGFGGVSSLMTWGATFMNATRYGFLHQVIEFLVHEITHCVLFAYSAEEPLVNNDPAEGYLSPLRPEPRPMDGIYHATLVCARLTLFISRWRELGVADSEHEEWADEMLPITIKGFSDGLSVVRKDGKLSDRAWDLLGIAESRVAACKG